MVCAVMACSSLADSSYRLFTAAGSAYTQSHQVGAVLDLTAAGNTGLSTVTQHRLNKICEPRAGEVPVPHLICMNE